MNRLFSLKFKRNLGNLMIAILFMGMIFSFIYLYELLGKNYGYEKISELIELIFSKRSNSEIIIKVILTMMLLKSIIKVMNKNLDIIRAGVEGEKLAKKHIKNLKKIDYKVIPNVIVPKSKGGFRELDFVIIGTKGVFVIETKNMSGYIYGDAEDTELTRTKTGRGNRTYDSTIGNPIQQVKGQVNALASYMKKKKINCNVDYIVAFTNEKASINISNDEGKVIKLTSGDNIVEYINKYNSNKTLSISEVKSVYKGILSLRYNLKLILNPVFLVGCIKDDILKLMKVKDTLKKLYDSILLILYSINDVLNRTLNVAMIWMRNLVLIAFPIICILLGILQATFFEIENIDKYISMIINFISVFIIPIPEIINVGIILIIYKVLTMVTLRILNLPMQILRK